MEVMSCVRAFYKSFKPCVKMVSETCLKESCAFTATYSCNELTARNARGYQRCENLVSKICVTCGINEVRVPCYQEDVVCLQMVKAELRCEHEISWRCGSDPDPRLDPESTPNCTACVIPRWHAAIEQTSSEREFSSIEMRCRMAIRNASESISEVLESAELEYTSKQYRSHLKARTKILKTFSDMLSRGSKERLALPPPAPGSVDDLDNYDLVFRTYTTKQSKTSKTALEFMKRKFTTYGSGAKFSLLTAENLRAAKPDNSGILHICVGMAYRHCCLKSTPQFCPGEGNRKKGDRLTIASQKADNDKMANNQLTIRMQCGYDCVDVYEGAKDEEGTGAGERIYWSDCVVIPLSVMSLKLHVMCEICRDHYSSEQGLCCSKRHFVCWENCFYPYVESAGSPNAAAGLIDTDGNLRCPNMQCKDRYNAQTMIDSKGDARAVDALEGLRKTAYGLKQAAAVREQIETEHRLENERIQRIEDLNEREAHIARRSIVTDILNLQCPRCKAVFNNFVGCFALTCSRNECRAAFCAWCLRDCGPDAHTHVASCPEGRGIFSSIEVFNEHHRARRERKVREIVNRQTDEVRVVLVRIIQRDLAGLGITL